MTTYSYLQSKRIMNERKRFERKKIDEKMIIVKYVNRFYRIDSY